MARRTGDSLIFGVPARETTSKMPKFDWTPAQLALFRAHIRAHPRENDKYYDLEELLQGLDLDGYDNHIRNREGYSVRTMIYKKVKSKLSRMRKEQPGLVQQGQQAAPAMPVHQQLLNEQQALLQQPPQPPHQVLAHQRYLAQQGLLLLERRERGRAAAQNANAGARFHPDYNINIIDPDAR
jgi:hypothetical protein